MGRCAFCTISCGFRDAASLKPNFSWLLRDRKNGALVGMVLCSRVAARRWHTSRNCASRRRTAARGLGRALLRQSAETLLSEEFEAITLTVTEANVPAVKLYERFGFSLRHRFDAMAMDTRTRQR
jgi:ribosomal protein S18 acetylase RimI-like enzyme